MNLVKVTLLRIITKAMEFSEKILINNNLNPLDNSLARKTATGFIQARRNHYPVAMLCRAIDVSSSAYYDWRKKGAKLIDSQTWHLYQQMKMHFTQSRESMGSRRLMKQLCKEGFQAGRYRIRFLMKKLGLVVKRKRWFVLTTDSKHSCPIAPNIMDRQFSPGCPQSGMGAYITYIWTLQGWLYLTVVIDLYSRRVIGWSMDKQMKQLLMSCALLMAINYVVRLKD